MIREYIRQLSYILPLLTDGSLNFRLIALSNVQQPLGDEGVVEKEPVATTRMEEEEEEQGERERVEEMEEIRHQEAEQRNGGGESILNGDSGEPSYQGFFSYLKYCRIPYSKDR